MLEISRRAFLNTVGTGLVTREAASLSAGAVAKNRPNFVLIVENRVQTATIPGMDPITYVYDGDGQRVQKTVGSTTTT
jgi:YD repeat-containing protein